MRFSIRDLLWFTALVALAVGWSKDYRSLKAEIDKNHILRAMAEDDGIFGQYIERANGPHRFTSPTP